VSSANIPQENNPPVKACQNKKTEKAPMLQNFRRQTDKNKRREESILQLKKHKRDLQLNRIEKRKSKKIE
jgi:hypothetical protein